MSSNAWLRGSALACALGRDRPTIRKGLRDGSRPVRQVSLEWAHIPESRPYYLIAGLPDHRHGHLFYDILFDTVGRAIADAAMTSGEQSRLAVFFGSTSMDMPLYESAYEGRADRGGAIMQDAGGGYGQIAARLSERFALTGPAWTFMTACTSSANAILYATDMLRAGRIERALVVGYDLFNHLGFYGFESLRLLSPGVYRPLDARRDGIVMGEGCGAMILEPRNGDATGIRIAGGANLCDTHNVTTHDPEGRTIRDVMEAALQAAGVGVGDIRAVKAHATGSENNDRAECAGMKRFFGNATPPVTAIKPYVGHTVGAAGVIETILLAEALEEGFLPATPGFEQEDRELGIVPLTEPGEALPGFFLLNWFGFGGNCISLVVENRR